jgi:hypothetical protein
MRRTFFGGAGSSPNLVVRQQYISNLGRITLPNTASAWARLTALPTLEIPAAAGDYVEVTVQALKSPATGKLDVAVLAGGSLVRFMASGGASPGFDGDPGWQNVSGFLGRSSPHGFVVASGDLTGSNVVLCVAVNADGTGTIDASSDYPFFWQVKNFGTPA